MISSIFCITFFFFLTSILIYKIETRELKNKNRQKLRLMILSSKLFFRIINIIITNKYNIIKIEFNDNIIIKFQIK